MSTDWSAPHEFDGGLIDTLACVAELEADRFAGAAQRIFGGLAEDGEPTSKDAAGEVRVRPTQNG